VAAEAAADIQRLQTEVLTENNVKALRESVQTLTKTLQHIERITGGWLGVAVWVGAGGWAGGRAGFCCELLGRGLQGAAVGCICAWAWGSPPPPLAPPPPLPANVSCRALINLLIAGLCMFVCRGPGWRDRGQAGDLKPQAAHRGTQPHRGGLRDGCCCRWCCCWLMHEMQAGAACIARGSMRSRLWEQCRHHGSCTGSAC
jgi:hypothetical protein